MFTINSNDSYELIESPDFPHAQHDFNEQHHQQRLIIRHSELVAMILTRCAEDRELHTRPQQKNSTQENSTRMNIIGRNNNILTEDVSYKSRSSPPSTACVICSSGSNERFDTHQKNTLMFCSM